MRRSRCPGNSRHLAFLRLALLAILAAAVAATVGSTGYSMFSTETSLAGLSSAAAAWLPAAGGADSKAEVSASERQLELQSL
jgi:hypothetical protein